MDGQKFRLMKMINRVLLLVIVSSHWLMSQWQQLPNAPGNARDDGISAIVDGQLFTGLGRDLGFYVQNDWWHYDIEKQQWQQLDNVPFSRRQYSMVAVHENKVVVFGGELSGELFRDVWKFNPIDKSWQQQSSLPKGIKQGVAFSTPLGLVCGMGLTDEGKSDSLFVLKDEEWTFLSVFPGGPRDALSGFAIAEHLFLGWGRAQEDSVCLDWWSYDMRFDKWRRIKSPGSIPRYWTSSASGAIGIGIAGLGMDVDEAFLNDLWVYRWPENRWRRVHLAPTALRGASVALDGDNVHLLWGVDQSFDRQNKHHVLNNTIPFESRLKVYPNPGNGTFRIAKREEMEEDYKIINASGSIIQEFTCKPSEGCAFQLTVSGLYLLINNTSGQYVKVIVI